jgi:large repetitive protein
VQPGQTLTYTIAVSNAGPADALAVSVTDPLPSGLSYLSCSASQGTCANGSGTVTASFGTIPAGSSATLTISVTVVSPAGAITNTATVASSTPDSNPNNDSDTRVVVGGSTIPTLSSGMLALLAVLLAALGVAALRRLPS